MVERGFAHCCPIETKNKDIMACCLLHNFIRQEMEVDPFDNDAQDEGTGDVGFLF